MALVKASVPLTEDTRPQTVVDIVGEGIKIRNDETFYGLYNTGFPRRPWASSSRLLLNTNQKTTVNSYIIDIVSGDVTHLKFDDGSQLITDVFNDTVLAVRRNFFKSDKLVIGKLPSPNNEAAISWTELTSSEVVSGLENCSYKYLDLLADSAGDSVRSFNAIYLGPGNGKEKIDPAYNLASRRPSLCICKLFNVGSIRFALLLVNYRGSIGSGQDSVEFLLGKVGTADVADCITAIDKTLELLPWLNPEVLALVGGSHGGFLVTHLSGQYPEKFKAVVARNPVIDVAPMSSISDIPDWAFVEGGNKEYTQRGAIDNESLLAMRNVSPIVHAHKVKAPTLLQIGSKDLRVPPHQGTEYHLRLKANGVITRMNLYEDNHPLGSVPNEMDNVINTFLWIDKYISNE
ncbi:hypothetical protein NQ315_005099 [Exocentrus adspersus]|uniref:acylaminoacyl-peptidase n=1 Tax=Exocentrus adspersus TaxID=1586481 RepID=A0AAV8VUC1_9CUCU|nr:hypothetical protein NQ315_005099 [Exocentrus adspersus]